MTYCSREDCIHYDVCAYKACKFVCPYYKCNTSGDLISREALKKHKFPVNIANGVEIEEIEVVPVGAIDNALSVESDIEVVAKDAYKQGYTDGWKERFGEPNERLQGEREDSSSDAISRQAAQDKIKAICEQYYLSYEEGERRVSTGGSAYALGHAFDDLPSVKENKWISVSERLPEGRIDPNIKDFEYVLCSTTWDDVRPYRFGKRLGENKAHFWLGGAIMDKYITAWQPFPESYKKGSVE